MGRGNRPDHNHSSADDQEMSVRLSVDAVALLKWARYLDQIPKRTRPAVAHALNDYGAGVVRSTAEQIAERADLDPNEVMSLIEVKEATAEDLTWRMDATQVAPPSQDWERPWAARDSKQFQKQTLVKIVTTGDDRTCDVCNDAAAKSPYTMDEIDRLASKWKDWEGGAGATGFKTNLIHPNCRCVLQPWAQTRRLSVSFQGKGAPPELLNARQLGKRVADELKVSIRAIRV